MSSLRMTIIMMVSYISCPFPAKAEALLPCACTEAPLPLKRPGEEGSARCSLLEFLQKWPIFGICQNLTPKKGDTSRDPKTRLRFRGWRNLETLCQIIVSREAGGKSILPTAWLCLTTSRLWISSHPYRSGGSDAPLCDSTRLLSKRMFTFRPALPRRKGRRHDAQGNLFFGNVAREHVLRRRKYSFGH